MVPLLEMGMPFPVLEDTGLGGGKGGMFESPPLKTVELKKSQVTGTIMENDKNSY